MAAEHGWLMALAFFSCLASGSMTEEMTENIFENRVALATGLNLGHLINQNRILLIMCYVPWDIQYQEKIGDYEKLAEIVFKSTEDVTMAKLDMAAEPVAANSIDVHLTNGLQFIFYRKGQSYNFADFTDITSLSKRLKVIADVAWTPPEVPLLIKRVEEIQKKDFVNDLVKQDFAVVLFYNPSSLASHRMLYDFELAIASLDQKTGVGKQGFFKFNGEDQPETLNKYGVKGLPAVKFFRGGKVYDYNGPMMNLRDIKGYITGHMEKPFQIIGDPRGLEEFTKKNSDRPTVVGFFASIALASFPNFVEAAQTLRDRYSFVLMSTPMVSNGEGIEPVQAQGWTLAVFLPKRQHTPDDERKSVLQYEDASLEMMLDFIKWKATPLAGERTLNSAGVAYSLRPLVVVYSKVDWKKPNQKETEYLRDKVASAAKDHKDTLFAFSDSTVFRNEVTRFGFDTGSKYELHVGILGKDGEYYPRWDTAHMSAKMISEFVKQYKEGEVKPFYRSNATLHSQHSVAGVKELTGDTFKSEILDSPYDALVLLYHPLARYWRLAQSVLKDLAEDAGYQKEKLVFAEMDASTNDAPAYFRLPTYPVIYFVPKHDKQNLSRIGGELCNADGIRKFLKEQLAKSAVFVAETKAVKTEL